MLFRLIVLLMGGLFLAMYFVPEGSRTAKPPRPAAVATNEPGDAAPQPAPAPAPAETAGDAAGSGSLPPVPAAPSQDVAPAPAPLVAPPAETAATEATPDASVATAAPGAEGEAADPFAAADPGEAPLDPGTALPELGQLGGAGGTSDAVSLSDSVRERTTTTGLTPPPLRPGAEPAAEVVADPAAAAGAAPAAAPEVPAASVRPPVGPVTGPRAQVTATSVNLRASPSTTASVVGRVNFGDTVVVTQQNPAPGWTGIRNPRTGEVAYVSSQFLQLVP